MSDDHGISRRALLLGRFARPGPPSAPPAPTTPRRAAVSHVPPPPVLPSTGPVPVPNGTARIKPINCIAFGPMSCTVCSEQCPEPGAIVVEQGRPRVVDDACTGCGMCQHVCPAPYPAVIVMPREVVAESATTSPPPQESESRFDWRAAYLGDR